VAFRKRIYTSLEQLQADLDTWITGYNEQPLPPRRPLSSGQHKCEGGATLSALIVPCTQRHLTGDVWALYNHPADTRRPLARTRAPAGVSGF
jgi:hypothetical protein